VTTSDEQLVRFMGLDIATGPSVLVPREETELLARAALELLAVEGGTKVIDMCTGAGNLACALASARPELHVWASDLTDSCVALARRNVARLGLEGRVEVHQGDLFASLRGTVNAGEIDLVVCNPPYIRTGRLEKEAAHLLEKEPREAFDGGPYGLSIHRRVIREAPEFLRKGGWLAFEMGLGQDRQLLPLFARYQEFDEPRIVSDASGAPRVAVARFRERRSMLDDAKTG
jgi:HemK-like putative methylase